MILDRRNMYHLICNLRDNDMSFSEIASTMNRDGVLTSTGHKWTKASVHKFLDRHSDKFEEGKPLVSTAPTIDVDWDEVSELAGSNLSDGLKRKLLRVLYDGQ